MSPSDTEFGVRPVPAPPLTNGEDPLDAYSRVVTSVARRLIPSVASLRVMVRVTGGRRPQGSGSGVVVTPDGFLLTSAHVVERATNALGHAGGDGTATFADGREVDFRVVGSDRLSDLAVVRASASGLEPATLGDAD